jgi:hypothetical protein
MLIKPQCIAATVEKMTLQDALIIDNGEYIFFYIGSQVPDSFINSIFGYANFSDLKFNNVPTFTPLEESETSKTLWALIEQMRAEKGGGAY